jgi:hypothetical protein
MKITQYIMSMFMFTGVASRSYCEAAEYTHGLDYCKILVEPELCDIEKGKSFC